MRADDHELMRRRCLRGLGMLGLAGAAWPGARAQSVKEEVAFAGGQRELAAYRVPDNDCQCVAPGTAAAKTRPISLLPVRSFITSLASGDSVPGGRTVELKGIAFDGGAGIREVQLSIDGGASWRPASLGRDLGPFSFREWKLPVRFAKPGPAVLMVRAANRRGEVQPLEADWNPSGYRRHVVESYHVVIA